MNIELITVGPFEVNCAVVWGDTQQAFVIDPGFDAPLIESCLAANGLAVAAYLLTHGHADHISSLAELHAARPAPVYIHTQDLKWAFGEKNQIPSYYPVPKNPDAEFFDPTNPPRPTGTPPQEGTPPDPLQRKGDRSNLSTDALTKVTNEGSSNDWKSLEKSSELQLCCLETPGHTPGGVCYWFKNEEVCFTGDTLFKGSCGRTDLPGGDARTLSTSLKKLAQLPPQTRVIAGHGDGTTIAYELKTNFFLKSGPAG